MIIKTVRSAFPKVEPLSPAARLTAIIVAGMLFCGVARAEPVNLFRIPLTNNAPAITTMPSDTSLGGASFNVTMYNASGAASDLAGLAGSGVNGAATGAAALSLTNGETGAAGTSANNNGAANCAADNNDSALGFGIITNFVLTFWFDEAVALNDTSGETLPRMFVLDAAGGTDDTANSIGLKFQLGNQWEFEINNATTTTGNSYGAPANTASLGTTYASGFPPANKWVFVAWVYDGTNIYQYTGSDSAVTALQNQFAAAGLSVNLGSSAYLFLGNRGIKGTRGFYGWMEDVRLYSGVSTNNLNFLENIRKSIAPHIPTITGVYPDGTALQQAANQLVFTANSSSGFNLTNFSLVLNGVNVSGGLQFVTNGTAGTSTNVTASYTGLPQQTTNSATMTATDALGLTDGATVNFDTFSPNNFAIKAEEFDFNGGMYIDNPDYTDGNPADANSYYGLSGMEGIDTHKGPSVGDNLGDYRYDGDTPAGSDTQTPLATGELPLPRIVNAPLDGGSSPQQNHMIADWSSGEWQNYTKTFPAGNYNVWARLSTSSGSAVNFDQVTSGQGTTSQTTSRLGQFTFSGAGTFQWVELMQNGSPAVINLGGVKTVRATTGGGANADLYMLVPANANLPVISSVHPDGSVLFQYTAPGNLTFTVSSSVTTINPANVTVTLNGNPVSVSCSPNAPAATLNCTCSGLAPNQTYATTIHALDNNGNSANAQLSIDTWEPVLQFEAEDYDFDPSLSPISDGTGFRFIDNPSPTSVPSTLGTYKITAANSYVGQTGDDAPTPPGNRLNGIDQFGVGAGTRPYRPGDVGTAVVVDTPRTQFAHNQDFNIGFLGAGFWENYTRTWPAGTYNLYGRMASGAAASGLPTPPGIRDDVDLVVAGYGTTNQIVSYLGTFNIPTTGGYSSYSYYPLIDRFGNYAQLNLSGKETLRSMLDLTTTTGAAQFGLNVNFYMLTAPRTDLPRIDNVVPDGSALMQQGSTLSFVASSPTYGLSTAGITVTLNGNNISSSLVFSGSSPSWNVSFPGLQPNTNYSAVISLTDSNNQTHATTVNFDTFSPSYFTWEAEDFDFGPENSSVSNGSGLRYIDNPAPTSAPATNSYFGQVGDQGIDESPIFFNTLGTYIYRSMDGVSTEVTSDAPRQKYLTAQLSSVNPNISDYDVNNFTNAAWLNYTRTFPAGNFHVYARVSAGNGPFNMACAQVTSGFGTMTQTTQPLGNFVGTGTSFFTWQYVPLVNTNTGLPVTLALGGVETLQITGDGNEHANFFMLAPVAANAVSITPTINGSNIQLSFPTQVGFNYTIQYKHNLTDPSWTTLGSAVPGNGSTRSVNDSASGGQRFYRLSIQ
jgi:hypothetical protein